MDGVAVFSLRHGGCPAITSFCYGILRTGFPAQGLGHDELMMSMKCDRNQPGGVM